MPIYEYVCESCGRASSHFFRSVSSVSEPTCPGCGSSSMRRLISKTFHVRGESERLSSLDMSRLMSGLDGSDPASFERWARKTGSELDSELGSNFRELADRTAAGEDPVERIDPGHSLRYQVEKKITDVGGDTGSSGAGGE